MDTQIRPVSSTPVVIAPTTRPTLSLPSRTAAANATVTSELAALASELAALASGLAATANKLREAILRCAAEAQHEEVKDTEARLHCFIAKLSGSMECLGEVEIDHALWDLMKLRAEPCRRSDASAAPLDGAPL
jgi:hypothetical protein